MQTKLQRVSPTIASFPASFAQGTRGECALHMVRAGSSERVGSHTTMRSPDAVLPGRRLGEPWELTVTLSLTEEPAGEGKTKYSLEATGYPGPSTWHSGKSYEGLHRSYACALAAGDVTKTIPEKEAALFYIEGDKLPFNAAPTKQLLNALSRFQAQQRKKRITPMEFAEQSKGNFMVVTLRWYNAGAD